MIRSLKSAFICKGLSFRGKTNGTLTTDARYWFAREYSIHKFRKNKKIKIGTL